MNFPPVRHFSYGFYIRHARNVVLDNVHLDYAGTELRPAVMADDVEDLRIEGLNARTASGIDPIRLLHSERVNIAERDAR